ncbi:MAG TPA: hypothetical protein VEX60_16855 [Pyrinomonadaceae bacterium]|nr:hypothetical protein [Pyrinomonadaceae bacterium]
MAASRPIAITVICVIGFIGVALGIPALLAVVATGAQTGLPGWYMPYLGLTMLVGLASLIGMWMMKKWGALLYAVMFVVNQIILFATGLWTPGALIIPLIVTVIALSQLPKMD